MGEVVGERSAGFVRSVNWVFLATIAAYLLSFLTNIAVTRVLSADDRGLYAIFLTSVTLAGSLFSLGYHHAAIYFIGRGETDVPSTLNQGLYVVLAAAAGATALAALAAVFARERLPVTVASAGLFVAGSAVLVAVTVVNGVLIAEGRFRLLNLLNVLRAGLQFVLVLPVAWLGLLNLGAAAGLWVLSLLLGVGVAVVLLGPERGSLRRSDWPRWQMLRRTTVFGLRGQGGNLAQILNYRLDSYLLLAFAGRSEVAYYAVATAVAETLWFLPNAVSTVLLPRLTRSEADEAARFTLLVSRATLALSLAGALVVAATAPIALPLVFGAAYSSSVPALHALLPGVIAGSVTKVLANYIFGRGRVGLNTAVALVALVVTVVFDLLLIPTLGTVGAGLASSTSYGTSMLLTLWLHRRLSGRQVWEAVAPQPGDLNELLLRLKQMRRVVPISKKMP